MGSPQESPDTRDPQIEIAVVLGRERGPVSASASEIMPRNL